MANTNFAYLRSDWPELYRLALETERASSARAILLKCRLLVEVSLDWLFENEYALTLPEGHYSLDSLMNEGDLRKVVPGRLVRELNVVRREGNMAAHEPDVISWGRAKMVLKHTHGFLSWLDANYGEEPNEDRRLREQWLPPNQKKATNSQRIDELEERLTEAEVEIERLRRENTRLEGRLQDNKARYAALKMKQDLAAQRKQRNTERGINHEDRLPHPYSDEETRRQLVAVRLREAGWNPEDPNFTNEKPDYVLRNPQGLPLAILESFGEITDLVLHHAGLHQL